MSSKSKTKTNQNNSIDPWSQQQWESVSQPILNYANKPVTAYDGELHAGLDPLQTQAAGMAQANVGAGQGALGQAIGTAGGVAGYHPGEVTAGQLAGMDYGQYMNPYLQSVLGSTMGAIEQQREQSMVGNSQAAGGGAWGGSRHGVADSLTNEAALREASSAANNIFAQGFNNAQQAGQFDISNQLGADQFNVNSGLAGQGLNLNASNALAGYGLQQQQMGANDALLTNQFGTQAQQNSQQALDAAYQEFLRQQQQGMAQQGLNLGVLGSVPQIVDSKGSTTQSASPGFGQILGSALSLGSMFFNPFGATGGGG